MEPLGDEVYGPSYACVEVFKALKPGEGRCGRAGREPQLWDYHEGHDLNSFSRIMYNPILKHNYPESPVWLN